MTSTQTLTLNDPTLLRTQAYIGGAWVDADDGKTLAVSNPATGRDNLRDRQRG